MSRWISCDDVFERLTRGPFPSDADGVAVATAEFSHRCDSVDERVEAHLAACHECRMLAEALRPAASELGLAAALRPGSESQLPLYRGRLPELTVSAAPCERSLDGTSAQLARGVHRDRRLLASWPLALAVALGVVVGALAAGGWFERPGRSARQLAWSVGPVDRTREIDEADAVLSSLRLPTVCWHPESISKRAGSENSSGEKEAGERSIGEVVSCTVAARSVTLSVRRRRGKSTWFA